MKKLLISLFVIITACIFLDFKILKDDKLADGYVITKEGTKTDVKFILENKALLVSEKSKYDISDYRMQHGPKYIGSNGKKQKVNGDITEYGFEYADDKFIYQIAEIEINSVFGKLTSYHQFCKLIIDGKCKLFYNFQKHENPLGGKIVITDYVIVKEGSKSFMVSNAFGGELIQGIQNNGSFYDYFSDCESLQKKVESKEFKTDRYVESVNYYNENCSK